MPSNKSKNPPKTVKKWSMYPNLHTKVSNILAKDDLVFNFNPDDSTASCIKEYDTNIMGRFHCYRARCPKKGSWDSKRVTLTIRKYTNMEYNARVYFQRCKGCNGLGKLSVDEQSYVDRVTCRLKKWEGIVMPLPYFGGIEGLPHETDLCEGCRVGRCTLDG